MSNQVKSGVARVYSNWQYYLRSHLSNIACIDNTCPVSKTSLNMYKVSTMAKVVVLCYTHLLNRFRVSKGYAHVQYFLYCILSSYFSWVTRAHCMQVNGLNQKLGSGGGLKQCIGSSHTREVNSSDVCLFMTT